MNSITDTRALEVSFARPGTSQVRVGSTHAFFSSFANSRAVRMIFAGGLTFCCVLRAQQDDQRQTAVRVSDTIVHETVAFPSAELPNFHPLTSLLLSPKSEVSRQPGFTSSGVGPASSLVFDVRNVHIPKGVTISIEGYETVVFRASGDITIDGDIQFPGGRLFILGRDRPAVVSGGIDVSGQTGGRGGDGASQGTPVGGNGGGGGGGGGAVGSGTGGAAGLGGSGAGGSSFGANGPNGGSISSLGEPVLAGSYVDCDSVAAGGSAGGSNGTAGANGLGRYLGDHYVAQPAFGSSAVGAFPSAAGGGSGGGGGCSNTLVYNNQQVASSGAGGGGGGGGAGGSVVIQMGAQSLEIDARAIKANGGNGGNGGNAGPPITIVNGRTNGSNGAGGGAGGAGGFIVLQGSTISLANGISSLSAVGGSGGAGGYGSAGNYWTGGGGYNGAGGGGGRIALYSSWPVQNVNPSAGSPASNSGGGTPTVLPVAVTMNPTLLNFVPRNSASDPSCGTLGGCTHQYPVTISPSTVTGVFTFQLSSSALKGITTNYCVAIDCTDPTYDTGPDYVFEGYRNSGFNTPVNQTIQTSSSVNSATVTVSSYDYGGSAKLSAYVNINGIQVTAGVTQPTQPGPVIQEPFARLPVDVCGPAGCRTTGDTNPVENCMTDPYSNCIADYWEHQVSPARYLNRNEDNEEGWPGSPSRGDGYSAHDEYRGFVIWDGTNRVHIRTDPVTTKDVFYYDAAGISDYIRTGNAKAILGPQTAPNINFLQIFQESANIKPPPAPPNTTFRHNRNGIGANEAFAIVYIDTGANGCPDGGVVLADAQSLRNNGAFPIILNIGTIFDCAPRIGMPVEVLLAQTVAHETGHKVSLMHPERPFVTFSAAVAPPFAAPADVGALGPDQYAMDLIANTLYIWLGDYPFPVPVPGGRIKADHILLTGGVSGNSLGAAAEFYRADPANNTAVFTIPLRDPIARDGAGNPDLLEVEKQDGFIMDWSPRRTLQTVPAWHFNPTHLQAICPKSVCP